MTATELLVSPSRRRGAAPREVATVATADAAVVAENVGTEPKKKKVDRLEHKILASGHGEPPCGSLAPVGESFTPEMVTALEKLAEKLILVKTIVSMTVLTGVVFYQLAPSPKNYLGAHSHNVARLHGVIEAAIARICAPGKEPSELIRRRLYTV